jgi:hypothetical protein
MPDGLRRDFHGHHFAERNIYEEGLSEFWEPILDYWRNGSHELRVALRHRFREPEAISGSIPLGRGETLIAVASGGMVGIWNERT